MEMFLADRKILLIAFSFRQIYKHMYGTVYLPFRETVLVCCILFMFMLDCSKLSDLLYRCSSITYLAKQRLLSFKQYVVMV